VATLTWAVPCAISQSAIGAALSLSFDQACVAGLKPQLSRKGRLGFRVNVLMDRCPKIEYQRLAS
jgi:hypothetical protein